MLGVENGGFMKTSRFFSLISLVLICSSIAFAQAGNKGGFDGSHQYNAYTLGKWGISAGTSGYGTFDSYAYSGNRYYNIYDNGNVGVTGGTARHKVGMFAPSMELMFHVGMGLSKYLDVGAYLPYYGDLAASTGALFGEPNGAGEAELWASGFGDLALWTKIRTELFPEDLLFSAAFYFELDIPTGEKGYGMRVRHPWYYNVEEGFDENRVGKGYTHPFTAGDFVAIPMLIGTFDFKKKGYLPLRWNNYVGMALASGYGANTLIYGSGINVIPDKFFDDQPDSLGISLFAEFHGESRFQKSDLPRMPLDLDVLTTTGGVTFNIKQTLSLTLAFEMSIKAYAYLFGDYNRNSSHGYKNNHISGYHGEDVTSTYAISATPYYGGHIDLTVYLGGKSEPPPEAVHDTIVQAKLDTIYQTKVDTIVETKTDTVYQTKVDTVYITATCPILEEKQCPAQFYPDFTYFKKGIHFKNDSYELQNRSKHILDELRDLMRMLPYVNLEIEAHTDSVGTEAHNDTLSENRAKAVVNYLVKHGVDPNRLHAAWKGEHQPVDDNGTEDGRRRNRRVELLPFDKDTGERAKEKEDGSGSDLYKHESSGTSDIDEEDDSPKKKSSKKTKASTDKKKAKR